MNWQLLSTTLLVSSGYGSTMCLSSSPSYGWYDAVYIAAVSHRRFV